MNSDKAFENTSDHYLGKRGEEYFGWQKGGAQFRAQIVRRKFAEFVGENDTIVDFGCGGGFLLQTLKGRRKIGIEINPIARDHANKECGVECYSSPSEVDDGVADVVISNHALEHVPYPIGMLKELHRILKPNGILVLCVPIDMQRDQGRFQTDDQNNHLHTWTTQLLGNTLIESGFSVEKISERVCYIPPGYTVFLYGRFPYWIYSMVGSFFGRLFARGHELLAVAKPATAAK